MNDYNDADRKSTDPRPTYIGLGRDRADAHHVYRTTDETIHVVAVDGHREHVYDVDGRDLDEYMDFVADSRGWAVRDYGLGIVEAMTRALEA